MAVDFEISQLSGTGTATIVVKPKAVNHEHNFKEQVLKIRVQGVEREVTLVQKAKPSVVETWNTYFTLTPDTTSYSFDGTKKNESIEIGVYSYQQKAIDGVLQEEYRAVDWEAISTVDWLIITKEVGETNQPGKLIIKTGSTNQEYSGNDAEPIERSGVITLTQLNLENNSKKIEITQSKGKVTFKFEVTGNGSIVSGIALNQSGSKDITLTIDGVSKRINNVEVKLYSNQGVKIPTLDHRITYEGDIPIPGGGTKKSRGEGWVSNFGNITFNWYSKITLNCNFQHDTSTVRVDAPQASMYGIFPKWPWQIDTDRLPPGCTLSNLEHDDSFYFLP